MTQITTSVEDLVAIKGILLQYKAEGVENPLLPLNADVDGDGIADAYALDAFGKVILVSNVPLSETVYVSDGDDILETGAKA